MLACMLFQTKNHYPSTAAASISKYLQMQIMHSIKYQDDNQDNSKVHLA